MTSYISIFVDGVQVTDFNTASLTSSMGENNSSASFNFSLMNYNGRFTNSFAIGDEIEMFLSYTGISSIYDEDFSTTTNFSSGTAFWSGRLYMSNSSDHSEIYNTYAETTIFNSNRLNTIEITAIDTKFASDEIWCFVNADSDDNHWEQIYSGVSYNLVYPGSSPRLKIVFVGIGGNETYISSLNIRMNVPIQILTGFIETIKLSGAQVKNVITVSGRDYTARLQDVTIPPEIYTNQEVSVIIKDFMSKYITDISTTNVDTTTFIIDRIVFNHTSVFDALKRLAEKCGYNFWVDINKILNFKLKGASSSGYTFNTDNVTHAIWTNTRQEIANQIWVYGDKSFSGWRQDFQMDGGSIITLSHQPYSTLVSVSGVGGLIYRGGVENMVVNPESGTQYLVNFLDSQIIFTSGTACGDNIPISGTRIGVNYDRSLPIIKFGRDRASIAAYKLKEKVIINKSIKDPQEAQKELDSQLAELSNPKLQGNLDLQGIFSITAGQTCIVNLVQDGIENKTYDIVEVTYTINKSTLLSDELITIKLNKRVGDVTDNIKQIMEDLKKIQAGDSDSTQTYTRSEFDFADILIKPTYWRYNRDIANSIVFDAPTRFAFDSALGSRYFDGLSGNTWVLQASGGYFP